VGPGSGVAGHRVAGAGAGWGVGAAEWGGWMLDAAPRG
jgi:hypothetical protein